MTNDEIEHQRDMFVTGLLLEKRGREKQQSAIVALRNGGMSYRNMAALLGLSRDCLRARYDSDGSWIEHWRRRSNDQAAS